MDRATVLGLVLAIGGIVGGFLAKGGALVSLLNLPGFLIVIMGTIGATMVAFPMSQVTAVPRTIRAALFDRTPVHASEMSQSLVTMADKARREGLLSLEEDAQAVEDEFARRGLMLMIDGTDPEALKSIMEIEIDAVAARHQENAKLFQVAGGFAPTLGVVGAVMGLITVLSKIGGGDASELGHGIAVAFVATFYGVGVANVILNPIAEKLKYRSSEERLVREMILEGILSIQAGDNPRIVREKLEAFLPPSDRTVEEDEAAAAPAARAA